MMMRSAAMVLALPALSMQAQGFTWGLQVGGSASQGQLATVVGSAKAPTFGAHLFIPMDENQAIRPRIELAKFSGSWDELDASNRSLGRPTATTSVRTGFFGADYLVAVSGDAKQGFYVLGTLGFQYTDYEVDQPHYNNPNLTAVIAPGGTYGIHQQSLAYGAGFGYQFTETWGIEARYVASKMKYYAANAAQSEATGNYGVASLEVTFRY